MIAQLVLLKVLKIGILSMTLNRSLMTPMLDNKLIPGYLDRSMILPSATNASFSILGGSGINDGTLATRSICKNPTISYKNLMSFPSQLILRKSANRTD